MMSSKNTGYQVYHQSQPVSPVMCPDGSKNYYFNSRYGSGSMKVFQVFPGVELVYNDFSMERCDCCLKSDNDLIEINYCQEGREECEWVCKHYLYLGAGDMCITKTEQEPPILHFPTGYYRGITIVLNLDLLCGLPLPLVSPQSLDLSHFGDKFCPDHHFFAMRANAHIAHIFSDLYEIPDRIRHDCFKVKVLELLLFLQLADPESERRIDKIASGQIDIVKAVKQRLCSDLRQSLTIECLAKEFCISPTSLKANFKMVYGSTIKEYIRKERMTFAASLLRSTNQTISDIASQSGYANQSKFAAAFKTLYGISPAEYRLKCRH